jgi:fructose/tagatose bisphosphate aldolase
MPIATPEIYAEMISRAKAGGFAYPAINVTSSQTLNAALRGFADAGSDGILQVSTGGAEYLSGPTVKDMIAGSVAFAAFAAEVAKKYAVNIALHTDHCPKDKLDGFVRPLLAISKERVARGEAPLFQSHMWDGSAVPLTENLQIAEELLAECAAAKVILEIEVGVVGGEEDGVENAINEKLYTTVEDGLAMVDKLGLGENGTYMAALTFGAGLRRGEDEHRHRYAVRIHPSGGRAHVQQLRRRAQGGRRGRQQEGVRPARLGQAGRGRPVEARRGGVRRPSFHRYVVEQVVRRRPAGRGQHLVDFHESDT